jgi:hypothetical protein
VAKQTEKPINKILKKTVEVYAHMPNAKLK